MGKLFGTDGIRGVANQYPLTVETAVAVGRAVAVFFADGHQPGPPRILIGTDTRESGDMFESALCAGICSLGATAVRAGVLPTPAVALLTAARQADAGIVVSASHNPYQDNGLKVFDGHGRKLSVSREKELETLIFSSLDRAAHGPKSPGRVRNLPDAAGLYIEIIRERLRKFCADGHGPEGLKVVLDCANGAAGRVAQRFFPGARVMFAAPDGQNINNGCGSEHPEALRRQVLDEGADAGFAFDGDGDRVIAIDETGRVISGDRILAFCAGYFKKNGRLRNNTVVSTVMSNVGLRRALQALDITHVTCDVGDRHVSETMAAHGAVVGGEDSGHIILADYQTTGDGLLTALMICHIMAKTRQPLSVLADIMTVCPQVIINVPVREKPDLTTLDSVQAAIRTTEASLGQSGRVLVRYSGTQPLCRVMVEAASADQAAAAAEQIARAVRSRIGE